MGYARFSTIVRPASRVRYVDRRFDVVHRPRSLDRFSVAASCVLSWLGQALSVGLDRAPILPKIAAAPARLRSAPPLQSGDVDAILALARREFDRAEHPRSFAFEAFERRVRQRLSVRVRETPQGTSTHHDTLEGPAPAAPSVPEPS